MTVKQLAADYMKWHAVPHKKPSTVKNDRLLLKAHVLPAIGKMSVSAVRRDDLVSLFNSMWRTPSHANRVRSLVHHMFNLAVQWRLRNDNPCERIRRFPEKKRETPPITEEQMDELRKATNDFSAIVGLRFWGRRLRSFWASTRSLDARCEDGRGILGCARAVLASGPMALAGAPARRARPVTGSTVLGGSSDARPRDAPQDGMQHAAPRRSRIFNDGHLRVGDAGGLRADVDSHLRYLPAA